jgi:hypothetical protein
MGITVLYFKYNTVTPNVLLVITYRRMSTDEHVGDVTIPTQVIEYNQNFLQPV